MNHTSNNTEPTQKRITLKSALIAILVTAIVAVCSTVIIMSHNAMQQQHTAPAAAVDNASDPSTQIPSDNKTPVNTPSANPADTEQPTTDTGSKNKGIPSLISAAPATDDIDGPKIYTVKTIGTCDVRKPSPDPSIDDWCQHVMDTDGGMVELLYYDGETHIFAQHNYLGGSWVNILNKDDTLIIDSKTYVVNDYEEEGLETAPDSGYYIQTCNDNGNHVLGLTLISN